MYGGKHEKKKISLGNRIPQIEPTGQGLVSRNEVLHFLEMNPLYAIEI